MVNKAQFGNNLIMQGGHTLIGVLASMLILALPITGSIKMQIAGLNGIQISNSQTAALIHVETMVERMLSNKDALDLNQYVHVIDYEPVGISDCNVVSCDPNQLALHDISWFQSELPEQLAYPKANVEIDPIDPKKWWVYVRWDQDGSGSTGLNCPSSSSNDLDCVRLPVEL